MKALALALVLAQVVDVPPPDAPMLSELVVTVDKGTPAPFAGVLLTDEQAIRTAKRVASAEAERDALKSAPVIPIWAAVVIGVISAGAAVAVTAGIYEFAKNKGAAP